MFKSIDVPFREVWNRMHYRELAKLAGLSYSTILELEDSVFWQSFISVCIQRLKECSVCGSEFFDKTKPMNGKYCNMRCQSRATSARYRKRNMR